MYSNYECFISRSLEENDLFNSFKSNPIYTGILEHCNKEQGCEYIKCIENFFPTIQTSEIVCYLKMNDAQGSPKKHNFIINGENVFCSPSSLRYVFHSLLILEDIKKKKMDKIVELGCGYGGLFLAINHFSKYLNIPIAHYYMIDLPIVCKLIDKYLKNFENLITYTIVPSYEFGANIDNNDLFLISNYCFSELKTHLMDNYKKHLFPKINHGFVIYQTCFDVGLDDAQKYINYESIEIEYPQTASKDKPNYYLRF
jgi:hypothetical protein